MKNSANQAWCFDNFLISFQIRSFGVLHAIILAKIEIELKDVEV